MALTPIDEVHALQIQAGTIGRKAGHAFEDEITLEINQVKFPIEIPKSSGKHLFSGEPGLLLLNHIASSNEITKLKAAVAISTGALATSEEGRKWLSINGANVSRCKSDIVVTLTGENGKEFTAGVSTKQCNNPTPTNAQLYFTTARGFVALLQNNGIQVSGDALKALREFCGDAGFRPLDDKAALDGRRVDPRRFFWEELPTKARKEWEALFSDRQDDITTLLLQKAYMDDPFVPDFLIHKTRAAPSWNATEVAIYSIPKLVELSRRYSGFATRPYKVRKGSYKDPSDVEHLAPRFGVVQMQRGGQAQHPEQLQFNLAAGYFYLLENL